MFIKFLSGCLSKTGDKIFITFWQNFIFKIKPRGQKTVTNIHIIKVFQGACLSNALWQIYVVVIRAYNRHPNEFLVECGTYFSFL